MKRVQPRRFYALVRASLTPLALTIAGLLSSITVRAEYFFNPAFLSSDPSAVADLSRFSTNGQAPGVYRVDLWLNGTFVTTRDINFIARTVTDGAVQGDDTGLMACLTPKAYENLGVNVQAFPALAAAKADS